MRLLCYLLLILPTGLSACSCGEFWSFVRLAVEYSDTNSYFQAPVVIRGTVLQVHSPHENFPLADFQISEVLYGDYEGEFVSMLGQDGGNCNWGVEGLLEGREYYVAFNASGFTSYAQPADVETEHPVYDFGPCSVPMVLVDGGDVSGQITETIGTMDTMAFLELLSASIAAGVVVSSVNPGPGPTERPVVFPNPAHRRATLRGSSGGSIGLYDAGGRRLRIWAGQAGEADRELDLTGLPPGVYLLVVEVAEGRSLQRLAVR